MILTLEVLGTYTFLNLENIVCQMPVTWNVSHFWVILLVAVNHIYLMRSLEPVLHFTTNWNMNRIILLSLL